MATDAHDIGRHIFRSYDNASRMPHAGTTAQALVCAHSRLIPRSGRPPANGRRRKLLAVRLNVVRFAGNGLCIPTRFTFIHVFSPCPLLTEHQQTPMISLFRLLPAQHLNGVVQVVITQ
jgi:hypothetical protein